MYLSGWTVQFVENVSCHFKEQKRNIRTSVLPSIENHSNVF